MSDLKIVVADNIEGPGLVKLRDAFGDGAVEVRGKFSEDELCEKISGMDALLIRSGTKVNRKAFEAGGRIKLVGRAGVGTDNIDKEAATERGVIVMNTPMGNTISAAEQAIALIFAIARNVARADRLMQENKWAKKELVGVEVHGKVLGLVGLGKIGGHVARVMSAAGMTVLAYDPFLSPDRAKQMGVELAELDDLLKRADFVSLHTPLTEKTKGMLSREKLATMKEGARLVNCARGGIVDESALAGMVQSGHLAAAGLDVFSEEPMTGGPLFGVKDITLTPHLGASTEEAAERCGMQMAEQVIAYFKEGIILNAVNIDIGSDPTLRPYVTVVRDLGRIAAVLLNAPLEAIEVTREGELFSGRDTAEITAAAVAGVMHNFGPEDVNLINAEYLARQRGIAISETVPPKAESLYTNHVEVRVRGGSKQTLVAGTAFGEATPRLIQIDDAVMDVALCDHMLFLRYPDTPGYVGKFGTIIANHDINISNMEVASLESRQRASMVIGLNDPASETLLDELRAVDGVERAWYVAL